MKTLMKTTIRNASKSKLLGYVVDMTQDYPHDQTLEGLRKKARECEKKTRRWFGETITFEEWASN